MNGHSTKLISQDQFFHANLFFHKNGVQKSKTKFVYAFISRLKVFHGMRVTGIKIIGIKIIFRLWSQFCTFARLYFSFKYDWSATKKF